METSTPKCLVCERQQDVTPLISILYQGKTYFICPQHFPVLIHRPHELAEKLPGLEKLSPVDHQH